MQQTSLNDMSDYVKGKVKSIYYESSDSFYKVGLINITESNLDINNKNIVITGSFGTLDLDSEYYFYGNLVNHPKYGKQFSVANYKLVKDDTESGLVNYFSGEKFVGIGKKTAKRIVDNLGINAIDKIINDSSVLDNLGLKKTVKQNLIDTLNDNYINDKLLVTLSKYGFNQKHINLIYKKYRDKALDIIKSNPYQLVKDIKGIGFLKADKIAKKLNFSEDSMERLSSAILTTLSNYVFKSGNIFIDISKLYQMVVDLLDRYSNIKITNDLVSKAVTYLASNQELILENNHVYLRSFYDSELKIAEHLKRITNYKVDKFDNADIDKVIRDVSKNNKVAFDEVQIEAIKKCLNNPILLLTGGPGTGKTTIINGIVQTYAKLSHFSLDINEYSDGEFPIILAAPTGRAAKRMKEITDLPACTIHKLLGFTKDDDINSLDSFNIKNINCKLLIIDEMSMVDDILFEYLLTAISNNIHVLLVGDEDQLPSVGPGQVFSDLLKSKCFPQVKLKKIYRQDNDSSIISLAHDVKEGKLPDNFLEKQSDRSFIMANENQISDIIQQVVNIAYRKNIKGDDIQLLSPMYRGKAGIDNLNIILQKKINSNINEKSKKVKLSGQFSYIGDRVIQLVNDPNKGVFNGDIGKIISIENEDTSNVKLIVDFDGLEVTYNKNDLDKLKLAYCISIHKAQGSQFKLIILPLVKQFSIMLKRNLLYTAITRAEKMLILLGDPSAYEIAVQNQSLNRNTTLIDRITDLFNKTNENQDECRYILTHDLLSSLKIDPMIGMDNVTPKDFKGATEMIK